MNETKHTPELRVAAAPTETEIDGYQFEARHVGFTQPLRADEGHTVSAFATVAVVLGDDDARDRYARLFAAAPELLDALKEWIAIAESQRSTHRQRVDAMLFSRKAIAKAEGRQA